MKVYQSLKQVSRVKSSNQARFEHEWRCLMRKDKTSLNTGRSSRVKPLFGININPNVERVTLAFELARLADQAGIELIGIQDHPYNGGFLETWTLLSALGAVTSKVRFFPNVADLPLRLDLAPSKLACSAGEGSGYAGHHNGWA